MPSDILAKQFNGCTSNCGSVCDYIVGLTDDDFEETINSLKLIGANFAAESLTLSTLDRLAAKEAIANHLDDFADNQKYIEIAKRIDRRKYENEGWNGWYK